MITIEKSIFINRPLQVVWDFVSDPTNDKQWRSGIESAEYTSDDPPGVGTTFRMEGRWLGRKTDSTGEITIWDPPHQFVYKSLTGSIPYESNVKLESKENGTLLTVAGQFEPGGFFKLAEGLIAKQADKQTDTDFSALKIVLEAGEV